MNVSSHKLDHVKIEICIVSLKTLHVEGILLELFDTQQANASIPQRSSKHHNVEMQMCLIIIEFPHLIQDHSIKA